jgi:hypothetical protein
LCNSEEVRGECDAALRPADGDDLVLQGLAQYLEIGVAELRKLVGNRDPPVAEAYLAGLGPAPAPDESGV